jgi:tRNA A37 methylthiotransferase MiaB
MAPAAPPSEIARREKRMKALDERMRQEFADRFKGKKLEVLTEANGYGYTSNYIQVKLPRSFAANTLIHYEQ